MAISYYVRKDTNTLIVADGKLACDLNMLDVIVESARDNLGAALFATKLTASYASQPIEDPMASQGGRNLAQLEEEGLVTKLDSFDDIVNVEI